MRAQKSHPSSIRITVVHARQSSWHRQSRSSEIQHTEACCRSQGAHHFVIPFHVLGRMQIPGSVTARDRPRSGFKFKFPSEGTRARYRSYLSASLRPVHLSPLSAGEDTCFPLKERGKKKKGYKRNHNNRRLRGKEICIGKPPSENLKSKIRTWRPTVNAPTIDFANHGKIMFLSRSSLFLARNNATMEALPLDINMHTCENQRAHHLSVFHSRCSHTRTA